MLAVTLSVLGIRWEYPKSKGETAVLSTRFIQFRVSRGHHCTVSSGDGCVYVIEFLNDGTVTSIQVV